MKEIEEQMCEENKKLDKHRASRNKIQQDYQQVQALKSRISMVEKKIESLENERTSIDQIKEQFTNKIKVCLLSFHIVIVIHTCKQYLSRALFRMF